MNYREITDGSVTSPKGFTAAGIIAGLKRNGQPDLALIFSDRPAVPAGAFTSNLFAAAPVEWDRHLLNRGAMIRAVVVNSGNANACTGAQGALDAQEMATYTAGKLGVDRKEVLVSSTGRIGVPMPMDIIRHGIDLACGALSADGGPDAAMAIITTDTIPKRIAVELEIGGKKVTIGAMTKGAGMIAPQMTPCRTRPRQATMLAYFTTDACIGSEALQEALNAALDASFNRIVVDGDTSTNDSMILLANGAAGNAEIAYDSDEWRLFVAALTHCAAYLAKEMVRDGEGVSKFVELVINGAPDDVSARKVAESIARSPLCKTAWFGADPNWGRILCAAGYSKVPFKPTQVTLKYDDVTVVVNGLGTEVTEEEMAEIMRKPQFRITLDLGAGNGNFVLWTCDLSHDYVTINADYHT
jgi:glutamate N-acetyltransferase/amino-acid N-acetyltransferase